MSFYRYYVAYGSNLNIKQMKRRCPSATVVGITALRDYQLLFKVSKTGAYLTIEKCEGKTVPVVIWKVTPEDEMMLDFYEGCPTYYYKTTKKITLNGRKIRAFVYIMHENRMFGIPSKEYIRRCRIGYKMFNFDLSNLTDAIYTSYDNLMKLVIQKNMGVKNA